MRFKILWAEVLSNIKVRLTILVDEIVLFN